jgi:hypothetical protein
MSKCINFPGKLPSQSTTIQEKQKRRQIVTLHFNHPGPCMGTKRRLTVSRRGGRTSRSSRIFSAEAGRPNQVGRLVAAHHWQIDFIDYIRAVPEAVAQGDITALALADKWLA